jgi:hypothetical protein
MKGSRNEQDFPSMRTLQIILSFLLSFYEFHDVSVLLYPSGYPFSAIYTFVD